MVNSDFFMNILDLTITQLHEGFRNKNFTSVEVTKAYLENIKKTDKEIGAYLLVTEGLALNQAEKADKLISLALSGVEGNGGDFPLLMGVPF